LTPWQKTDVIIAEAMHPDLLGSRNPGVTAMPILNETVTLMPPSELTCPVASNSDMVSGMALLIGDNPRQKKARSGVRYIQRI